jgi:hypothetical protein
MLRQQTYSQATLSSNSTHFENSNALALAITRFLVIVDPGPKSDSRAGSPALTTLSNMSSCVLSRRLPRTSAVGQVAVPVLYQSLSPDVLRAGGH